MPKKGKRSKKKKSFARPRGRLVMRRNGGYITDAWNGFKNWSRGAGKPFMDLGTDLAGRLWPGSDYLLKGLRTIMGTGAYDMSGSPSLLASPVPDMHSAQDAGVRICHKEFVANVYSSTTFSVNTYSINPGDSTTFPWLASQARGYQKYEFKGLAFCYKKLSANALNSTNTALGEVIGATEYSMHTPSPTDKQYVLNLCGARAAAPSESNVYPVECNARDRITKNLLVRSGSTDGDLQLFDAGKFYIATDGSQASAKVGELYVCYDIIMRQPVLPPAMGGEFSFTDAIDYKDSEPLGTQAVVEGTLAATFSKTAITIPAGLNVPVSLCVTWHGAGIVSTTLPSVTLTNCTKLSLFDGGQPEFYGPVNGASSARLAYMTVVSPTVTSLPVVVTFGTGGSLPSSGLHCSVTMIALGINALSFLSFAQAKVNMIRSMCEDVSTRLQHQMDSDLCHTFAVDEEKTVVVKRR